MPSFFKAAVLATTAAFALATAVPALADTVYECEFKKQANNGGWLPSIVAVAMAEGKTVVNDPLIQHYVGEPLVASVETDNAKRTTLTWELKAKSSSNQYTRMKYRLTIMKADLAASMSATPQGYANNFTAQGKCKTSKV